MPINTSSPNALPEGGDSKTFCHLDDLSSWRFSQGCQTSSSPFNVQGCCSHIHSKEDFSHQCSCHMQFFPTNMQSSQCPTGSLDLECYQWNKFSSYSHLHQYSPSVSTTPPAPSEPFHRDFPEFRSAGTRPPMTPLQTFALEGPVQDGTDEEAENEDIMKHDSNINELTTLYLPLPHSTTTTPFFHASP